LPNHLIRGLNGYGLHYENANCATEVSIAECAASCYHYVGTCGSGCTVPSAALCHEGIIRPGFGLTVKKCLVDATKYPGQSCDEIYKVIADRNIGYGICPSVLTYCPRVGYVHPHQTGGNPVCDNCCGSSSEIGCAGFVCPVN